MCRAQKCRCNRIGVNGDEGPPVPIPNTVVKLMCAENTWLEAARENRTTPIQSAGLNNIKPAFFEEKCRKREYALIAQSVEHAAVNRGVTGSSPVWGAKKFRSRKWTEFFTYSLLTIHSSLKSFRERNFR